MAKLTKKQKANAINPETLHGVDQAIALAKQNATAKFDETIEVALKPGRRSAPRRPDGPRRRDAARRHRQDRSRRRLRPRPKADEARAAGADVVGAEDLMETIQGGTIDFDRCIATPDMMGVVGRLGKVLAPRPDAEPEAGHRDDERRRSGEGRQGRSGGIPRRKGRHHPLGHRQGVVQPGRPASQLRRAGRCGRQGEAVGRQGQVCPQGRRQLDDGPGIRVDTAEVAGA